MCGLVLKVAGNNMSGSGVAVAAVYEAGIYNIVILETESGIWGIIAPDSTLSQIFYVF